MTAVDAAVMAAVEGGSSFLDAILDNAERLYLAARRDTPTGTVIARLDPQADRQTWLTLRRTGIGSSDMAAVLGMSRYRSELDVYLDKIGETPLDSDDAGEAALWGNLLEHVVAVEWADRHGVAVRRVGTVAHVAHRHMICDLDRMVTGCPDHKRCALEVKTRSAWKADEWKDGAIPDDVEAQVMHQLAVTGLDAIHVAALVGGQRLESRLVARDSDYIGDLLRVGESFWNGHVTAGVPPTISSLTLLEDYLKRLTPEKGVPVDLEAEQERQVRHLTRIILESDRAEEAGEEARLELKAIIGEDATDILLPPPGQDDGKLVEWWTWRSQKKARRLDLDALAATLGCTVDELKAEFYTSDGTTRVLRKGKGVKAIESDDA